MAVLQKNSTKIISFDVSDVLGLSLPCVEVSAFYVADVNGDGLGDIVLRQKLGYPFKHPSNLEMMAAYLLFIDKGEVRFCFNRAASIRLTQPKYLNLFLTPASDAHEKSMRLDRALARAACEKEK